MHSGMTMEGCLYIAQVGSVFTITVPYSFRFSVFIDPDFVTF